MVYKLHQKGVLHGCVWDGLKQNEVKQGQVMGSATVTMEI